MAGGSTGVGCILRDITRKRKNNTSVHFLFVYGAVLFIFADELGQSTCMYTVHEHRHFAKCIKKKHHPYTL